MGEVRSTLEDKRTGPAAKLREVEDELSDLLTKKKADLKSEGATFKRRNEKSIEII